MNIREEFANWLQGEMTRRGWDQAELVRRSRVTSAQVSRILSGERKAGPETCVKLARALHLPPEEVFRQAGLLPRSKATPEGGDEMLTLFAELDAADRERLLAIAHALLRVSGKG